MNISEKKKAFHQQYISENSNAFVKCTKSGVLFLKASDQQYLFYLTKKKRKSVYQMKEPNKHL